jgi:hypothetical protein
LKVDISGKLPAAVEEVHDQPTLEKIIVRRAYAQIAPRRSEPLPNEPARNDYWSLPQYTEEKTVGRDAQVQIYEKLRHQVRFVNEVLEEAIPGRRSDVLPGSGNPHVDDIDIC